MDNTKLRQARLKRKLSLREVAEATGISYSMLCRLEIGSRLPSRETARKLYYFYGKKVKLADIYDPLFAQEAT